MSPPEPQAPEPITTDEVVFAEATPHQRVLAWTLNGASWAAPLTIEQYIGRETALSKTALSANGGTTYYILHLKSDADTIVSACEVTTKQAVVSDANGNRPVKSYAIASVFTNPRFRERGMASYMLRQVQRAVDEAGYEFGALYSDIGRQYYTRLGWKDFRSLQVTLTVPANREVAVPKGVTLLTGVETQDRKLMMRDVALLRERAYGEGGTGDGKTHVAFLPTPEQLAWHFARDRYVCKVLRERPVTFRGARTAGTDPSWIWWDHDLRENKLKILRLVTSEHADAETQIQEAKTLLMTALFEARSWGLPKVLVWSPSPAVAAGATEVWHELAPEVQLVFDQREDGSIPSLRWRGDKGLDEVVWEENEYYAWC